MATVERTLTINVRHAVIKVPAYRRAKKAVTAVREFLQQHMKSDNIKIGKYLNLKLWEHGIKNPAMRVAKESCCQKRRERHKTRSNRNCPCISGIRYCSNQRSENT
ncbi:60S ribosomal protein L31 [Candidatus Woesearchaeota archaeon]|nr:60S ribosomal protein L31 [Candidatus Woesearchaeota archaeon]